MKVFTHVIDRSMNLDLNRIFLCNGIIHLFQIIIISATFKCTMGLFFAVFTAHRVYFPIQFVGFLLFTYPVIVKILLLAFFVSFVGVFRIPTLYE